MLTTFAVYVDDAPGVLNRVSSLFRRRAFNISSLTVGHTDREGESRMTVVVDTDTPPERIEANLYKLIDVRRVEVLPTRLSVSRDLAMVKVATSPATRSEIMQLVSVFRARVVDVAPDSLIVEITGSEDKVDSLVDVLRPFGILEMAAPGGWRWRAAPQPISPPTSRRRGRDDLSDDDPNGQEQVSYSV